MLPIDVAASSHRQADMVEENPIWLRAYAMFCARKVESVLQEGWSTDTLLMQWWRDAAIEVKQFFLLQAQQAAELESVGHMQSFGSFEGLPTVSNGGVAFGSSSAVPLDIANRRVILSSVSTPAEMPFPDGGSPVGVSSSSAQPVNSAESQWTAESQPSQSAPILGVSRSSSARPLVDMSSIRFRPTPLSRSVAIPQNRFRTQLSSSSSSAPSSAHLPPHHSSSHLSAAVAECDDGEYPSAGDSSRRVVRSSSPSVPSPRSLAAALPPPIVLTEEQKRALDCVTPEPRRSLSSFFLFCQEQRGRVRAVHPLVKGMAITEYLAGKWRMMSKEERRPYDEAAVKSRQQYFEQKEQARHDIAALSPDLRQLYEYLKLQKKRLSTPNGLLQPLIVNGVVSVPEKGADAKRSGKRATMGGSSDGDDDDDDHDGGADFDSAERARDGVSGGEPSDGAPPTRRRLLSSCSQSSVDAASPSAVSPALSLPKKRPSRDPSAPKKPTPKFIYFCMENRDGTKRLFPHLKPADFQVKMGELWRALSAAEMERYTKLAESDMQRYLLEMEEYRRRLAQSVGGVPSLSQPSPTAGEGETREAAEGAVAGRVAPHVAASSQLESGSQRSNALSAAAGRGPTA